MDPNRAMLSFRSNGVRAVIIAEEDLKFHSYVADEQTLQQTIDALADYEMREIK
tara:strand:+ start:322 stop:483 length:162 start_codon:yes stop_codon:yes gene_type:complete